MMQCCKFEGPAIVIVRDENCGQKNEDHKVGRLFFSPLYTIREHDEQVTKLFFRRIKYIVGENETNVLLYTVRFFFDKKLLCVRRRDCYPDANPVYSVWRKTCSRNIANTFYTLFAVRCFAPILLLIANSVQRGQFKCFSRKNLTIFVRKC